MYVSVHRCVKFGIGEYCCVVLFQMQVLLADEQSTVRAVKRQQFKMFDDQYKFGDDLTQYVFVCVCVCMCLFTHISMRT